jgi:hypothetical protein
MLLLPLFIAPVFVLLAGMIESHVTVPLNLLSGMLGSFGSESTASAGQLLDSF